MHIIESISPSARSRGVILALNRLMSGHNSRAHRKRVTKRDQNTWVGAALFTPGLCCSFVIPHADAGRILFINVFVMDAVFRLKITLRRTEGVLIVLKLQHFLSLRVLTQS